MGGGEGAGGGGVRLNALLPTRTFEKRLLAERLVYAIVCSCIEQYLYGINNVFKRKSAMLYNTIMPPPHFLVYCDSDVGSSCTEPEFLNY
jgi:hypothetical protein